MADPPVAHAKSRALTEKTAARMDAYLDALRSGSRRGEAAKTAGTVRQTISDWRRSDPEFAAAEITAELEANELVEDALFQAAVSGNVTAIQVWLYNRQPDRWADKRRTEISGPGGGPIEAQLAAGRRYDELTDDELRQAEEREAARAVAAAQDVITEARTRSQSAPPSPG